MFLNPSNQLIQIDTGSALTYLYNSSLGLSIYAGIGENQVLGQLYYAYAAGSTTQPAIYKLVKYYASSAITTANLTTAAAPAPVYYTDNTFTTVTGITTEGIGGTTLGLNFPAGYLMVNTTSLTTLTSTMLLGAYVLIQVGGYLKGAYLSSTGSAAIGANIVPVAGTLSSAIVAAGTAPTYRQFGRQLTALSGNLCDVAVECAGLY